MVGVDSVFKIDKLHICYWTSTSWTRLSTNVRLMERSPMNLLANRQVKVFSRQHRLSHRLTSKEEPQQKLVLDLGFSLESKSPDHTDKQNLKFRWCVVFWAERWLTVSCQLNICLPSIIVPIIQLFFKGNQGRIPWGTGREWEWAGNPAVMFELPIPMLPIPRWI